MNAHPHRLATLLTLAACALPLAAQAMPKPHERSYTYDTFDNSFIRPATRGLDAARGIRFLIHAPIEAADVDANDQVELPSTWWQPRVGYHDVSPERLALGPGPGGGPAPGTWKVTSAKTQGVTPGFQIKDAHGDKFLIKFDVKQFPGCATAADVIGARLFWGAGYNVPDNQITTFTRDQLEIAKDATVADERGHKHPLTQAHLDHILATVAPPVNGRYRAMASRYLSGKPLGPFDYLGRQKDDPDDLVPHELRREIRGMWVFAAWLNHCDVRSANTLDMWVTEHGRSFVRHYLIDFGSTLGSTATDLPRQVASGHAYYIDYGMMGRELVTLGLHQPDWENATAPDYPSVGFIESAHFDPEGWRPDYPNPAFDDRTDRDRRWGVKILAAFTDDDIRAAVRCGQLPDPHAEDYLVRTLIERRDKLVRRWLGAEYVRSRHEPPAERASR
jgi:hypothetical protein